VETVRVDGLKELDQVLGNLTKATAGNVLLRALKKSTETLKLTVERFAPDDPRTGAGDLKSSITIEKVKAKGSGNLIRAVRVAPAIKFERTSKGKPGGRWYAAQALEFGWGDMPLVPYMRPAFDHEKMNVIVDFKRELKVEIDKAVARAARRKR
jgi:HK97 gp10 family phage protein